VHLVLGPQIGTVARRMGFSIAADSDHARDIGMACRLKLVGDELPRAAAVLERTAQ